MKKLGIVLGLVVMLAGCSGGKETTTVCKVENDIVKSEVTIESKGDEVTKQIMVMDEDLSAYTGSYTDEEMKDMYEGIIKQTYGNLEGISYKVEVKEGVAKTKLTIDYTEVDMKELVDAKLITKVDGKTPDIISLEKTVEDLEVEGATCKEK